MEQQEKNSTKKHWRQIDYVTRQKIEVLARARHNAREIAELVGYCKRTIERDLKQGQVTTLQLKPDPLATVVPIRREYRQVQEYSAEISQQAHERKSTAKGTQIKLGKSFEFAKAIAGYIKLGNSPYSSLRLLQMTGNPTLHVCLKTLYNYIASDYIPGITNADLPERGKVRKRDYNRARIALNNLKGTSIKDRPPEIAARTSFGHWEFDSVVGKSGTKEALLVMSERLTRHELIFKMRGKIQDEVIRIVDQLETELGSEKFGKIFKTVTCDNGSEFLDQSRLQRSVNNENQSRLQVYYCHPYAAYERGTNENINKMIRRFIPKGADIGSFTPAQIQKIQDHINSTPRLVLEGYPSNTRYAQHTA